MLYLFAALSCIVRSHRLPLRHNHLSSRQRHRSASPPNDFFFTVELLINQVQYQLLFEPQAYSTVLKGNGCSGYPQAKIDCQQCKFKGNFVSKIRGVSLSGSIRETNFRLGNLQFQGQSMIADQCEGLFQLQGVLGVRLDDSRTNIFKAMLDSGAIDQPLLTIDFNFQDPASSFVNLGQWDIYSVKPDIQLIQAQVIDIDRYQIKPQSAFVNSNSVPINFMTTIDPGLARVAIPNSMLSIFNSQLVKVGLDKACVFVFQDNPQFKQLQCSGVTREQLQKLPDLQIQLSKIVIVSYLDYVFKCKELPGKTTFNCKTLLSCFQGPALLLGLPLLNSNILLLDLKNKLIKLGRRADIREFDNIFQK